MSTAPPPVPASPSDGATRSPGCPARKLVPADEAADADGADGPDLQPSSDKTTERWVVRSFDVARQVLRDSGDLRQAGFGADQIARAGSRMRPPVLYLEGQPHRVQRKAAARFFAPKVTEDYREMMEALSGDLVSRLRADRSVDLSELSLSMAVRVAARVVGLTESSVAGMTGRLDSFFRGNSGRRGWGPRALVEQLGHRTAVLRFFYLDVKPAIRARRRRPEEDVISQLLEQGFSDLDILTECVTYGAAGMATTREFISVAAWHLLDDATLLARYRAAAREERVQILEETLRLEPVVGHLLRRTTAPVTLATALGSRELPAGSLVDLDLRAINADPATVGADPLGLCPARPLPRSVPPTLMSFGDGNHRCPGGPLALMESEIFLTSLFSREVVAVAPPTVQWNPVTQGYELSRFQVRLRRP